MPEQELTLVLPLKGRVNYTMRWLRYAQMAGFSFPIVVADGSEEADAVAVKDAVGAPFKDLRCEYLRFPFDATLDQYYAKLADVLESVKTPYAALADNDDFFSKRGLLDSVQFLSANSDHACCGGSFVNFNLKDRDKLLLMPQGAMRDIDGATAGERVKAHFAKYQITWYDVTRTDVLRRAFGRLKDRKLKDIFLAELLTSFLVVAAGKAKKLRPLYLMRQRDSEGSSAADADKRGDYFDRMLLPTFSQDFSALVFEIGAAVAQCDQVPAAQAQELVRKGYRDYITPVLLKNLKGPASLAEKAIRRVGSKLENTTAAMRMKLPAADQEEIKRIRAFLAGQAIGQN